MHLGQRRLGTFERGISGGVVPETFFQPPHHLLEGVVPLMFRVPAGLHMRDGAEGISNWTDLQYKRPASRKIH
jgi:hypothetical protein